jgi:hypothetical protein
MDVSMYVLRLQCWALDDSGQFVSPRRGFADGIGVAFRTLIVWTLTRSTVAAHRR